MSDQPSSSLSAVPVRGLADQNMELLDSLKALVKEIARYHPSFDARLFVQAERLIARYDK